MDGQRLTGHLAAGCAYAIFGLNIVFTKDIANSSAISPEALFGIRMILAAAVFWLASLFVKKEKVPLKDLGAMFPAALLGLMLPQYTFLKGITMASTIDTSILGSLTPVWTMIFAAIFLKEPLSFKKALGVLISFGGAMLLIFSSLRFKGAGPQTTGTGLALLLSNSMFFAAYLGIFRPLIKRYGVITLMKWMFLFSALLALPVSIKPIFSVNYGAISTLVYLETGYLVLFATVVAYFLIPVGQQRLRPTVVSMYTYLQPIIAVAISIIIGMDALTPQKIIAILLVFVGVFIVNRSKAAAT